MAAGSTDTLRTAAAAELPRPRGSIWEIPFAGEDLFELRQLVSGWASREAMPFERAEELVLAVHEIATNSVRHAGGVGMLRLWRSAESLVCEVQDAGHIGDPRAGTVRPGRDARCGRGLWIAHRMCDLIETRTSRRGTQIRMHKRLG
jgi:anti-sigma regulatory factor (Ser/Thr protein kinase)